MRRRTAEHELVNQLYLAGLPAPVREYRFHARRRWRFDLAFERERVAVEVEGGAFVRGRHNRGAGYREDCRKYNEAVRHGWRVLRFLPEMVESGEALGVLEDVLRKGAGDD